MFSFWWMLELIYFRLFSILGLKNLNQTHTHTQKTILSTLNYLGTSVENKLAIYVWDCIYVFKIFLYIMMFWHLKNLSGWRETTHPRASQFSCMRAKSPQSCPTLCDAMDCSPPGSSVHGICQARILEWVAMPTSRGSSWSRDRTHISYVSCIGRQVLYH